MVSITCPVLKYPIQPFKNPTSRFSTLISRPHAVHSCQGNGACFDKGKGFHKEQRTRKLSSMLVAGIISITAISATQESLAQMLGSQKGGAIFEKACIGCHYEGGNILQSGATLTIRDLERHYFKHCSPCTILCSRKIQCIGVNLTCALKVLGPYPKCFTCEFCRNGVATVEDIFNLTYYGKGRMPGFGEKCTPRGQCTFGPRLSDEDIRLLAEYVKAQADQGWPKLERT